MEPSNSQDPSQPSPEQLHLAEISRHFYFVKKREACMFPGVKTMLKMSIQKHMAKYEVDFLDNDQQLCVSLPLDVNEEDPDDKVQLLMEMRDTMKKARLLAFFRVGTIRDLEIHAQMTEISILGLKWRNPCTSQEREDLKVQQDLLAIHKAELEKQKLDQENWKN